jgi:hypothetical protein
MEADAIDDLSDPDDPAARQSWLLELYILTGVIFAAKPFGVMQYATSLPLPLRSIQPFRSSFAITLGLSGRLTARRHPALRRYCRNCRCGCVILSGSSLTSSNSTPIVLCLIQAILQFQITRSLSVIN